MTGRVIAIAGVVVLLIGVAYVPRVPAQQAAPLQTELLAEVRMLRQAIESLAGTNARVQIVFGRLQLQEQRTQAAFQRLEFARLQLSGLTQRVMAATNRHRELEEAIAENRGKPEQLDDMRMELKALRGELDQIEAERARAMTAEADAASALNQEQGRWSDLNRQLDDLERTLIKP